MEEKIIQKPKKTVIKTEKPVIVAPVTHAHKETTTKSLLVLVRIKGEVKVKPDVRETLYRLRLRRKYTCVLVNPNNKNLMGMIDVVKHSIAYGEIEKDTLANLMKARAQKIDKQSFDPEKIASELISGKNLTELGFKPFFRLHPPRKGINSKLQYPKGVLGNNKKDINKLVERML